VGVASGVYPYHPDSATAILKLYVDGTANLNMGAADLAGSMKIIGAQIVSEELGIPVDLIQIEHADTATTQYTRPSGGSKTIPTDGPPIRRAALEVKRVLLEMAAEQLKVPVSDLTYQDGVILAQGGATRLPITGLNQFRALNGVSGVGRSFPVNPADQVKVSREFFTNFAELEVNMGTGEIRVLRMLGAYDSGRPMNLLTYNNQIHSGMAFGFGLAVTERRVLDAKSGKMLNANFHDYKIATSKDVPEMTVSPIDPHDTECNSLGAKGLGEPANIPGAAAIANAFYNATGIRATTGPMTPPRVLALLARRQTRG
jgi:xanthine dehydrogenase YagR molybdenum-binding subunit